MQLGCLMALNMLFFHVIVNLSQSNVEQNAAGLVGLSVCILVYFGSIMLNLYGLWVPSIFCFIIPTGQTWRQRKFFINQFFSRLSDPETYKPKQIVYPMTVFCLTVSWIVFNCSDHTLCEQDYAFEGLILFCVAFLWVT